MIDFCHFKVNNNKITMLLEMCKVKKLHMTTMIHEHNGTRFLKTTAVDLLEMIYEYTSQLWIKSHSNTMLRLVH
uniref:Uncharacterized protein n=1 Tax=Anguilla anguilla TaxID=7936 RepID=A0A0E9WR97_ANGAN